MNEETPCFRLPTPASACRDWTEFLSKYNTLKLTIWIDFRQQNKCYYLTSNLASLTLHTGCISVAIILPSVFAV
jgi:hypothetical protein